MDRVTSPFQGASGYTAHAFGPHHTAQEVQHYGVRTEHAGRFPPPSKPHVTTAPPFSAPLSDTLMHGQDLNRALSPSPASTFQSQTTSLFSTHSPVSSIYNHPSSSGVSLCSGRESPAPVPPSNYSTFRPLSPPGRIGSPYSRPPSSRSSARPGSPLARHQSSLNGPRAYCNNFAGVARSASRRSNRVGSSATDHSTHQLIRRMEYENLSPGAKQEVSLDDRCASFLDEHMTGVAYGAHTDMGATGPPRAEVQVELDTTRQLPFEGHNFAPSPLSQSSQDATTMRESSGSNQTSPRSTDNDEGVQQRTIRVLRTILDNEFDLRLGTSMPPQDIVWAVSDCLDKISISLHQCRQQGYLVPVNSIPTSTDTPETTPPAGGAEPGDKPPTAPRKRGVSDIGRDDQDRGQGDDDDDDGRGACLGPHEPSNRKKPKVESYTCPFRKRNPTRFNIREWEYCSRAPFKTIPELKKHLTKYHEQLQLLFQCPRCLTSFPSLEDLNNHLRRDPDKMCESRGDTEGSPGQPKNEAVSSTVGRRFRSRAEHFDWTGIWLALFPGDHPGDIPSSEFEPAVELHEVSQEYKDSLPDLTNKLSATFGPGAEEPALGIFKDFIGGVFQRAQDQVQAITGVHGSTLSSLIKRHSRPPSQTPSPMPHINAGTPSNNTTSGTAARHIRPWTSGFLTGETSGASTPSSPLRNSPSRATHTASPSARLSRTGPSGYHNTQPPQNDYSPALLSSISAARTGPESITPSFPMVTSTSQLQSTNQSPAYSTDQRPPQFLQRQNQRQNPYQQPINGGHQGPPSTSNTHRSFSFDNSRSPYPEPHGNSHSHIGFANGGFPDPLPNFNHQSIAPWDSGVSPVSAAGNRNCVPETPNNFVHRNNWEYLLNSLSSLPDTPPMGTAAGMSPLTASLDEVLRNGDFGHSASGS